jgi:hypothetical protein
MHHGHSRWSHTETKELIGSVKHIMKVQIGVDHTEEAQFGLVDGRACNFTDSSKVSFQVQHDKLPKIPASRGRFIGINTQSRNQTTKQR